MYLSMSPMKPVIPVVAPMIHSRRELMIRYNTFKLKVLRARVKEINKIYDDNEGQASEGW